LTKNNIFGAGVVQGDGGSLGINKKRKRGQDRLLLPRLKKAIAERFNLRAKKTGNADRKIIPEIECGAFSR